MPSRALAFVIALAACSSAEAVRPLPSADAGSDDAGAAADATMPDATSPDAGPTAPALHVLFIGNSYTYVNDLPRTLARIAATSGQSPAIATDAVVASGATLGDLYTGMAARPAIARGGWTHVVLQGQSVEPLATPATFQQYAGLFAADARDAGATPTFYETWARVAGDPVYQTTWSGGSPSAMQDGMLMAYGKAAADANGVLVKVGEAWRAVIAKAPSIVLHQSDGSHPTPQGTWLAACVFYVRLTGNAVPTSSEVLAGVTPAEAAVLRDAALQAGH